MTEANGNVRKYLLKSILNRKFYDKFLKYNLGDVYNHNIYKCIQDIYDNDKDCESISTEYLADFYERQYGSRMGFTKLKSDKEIIFGLDRVKEQGPEIRSLLTKGEAQWHKNLKVNLNQ